MYAFRQEQNQYWEQQLFTALNKKNLSDFFTYLKPTKEVYWSKARDSLKIEKGIFEGYFLLN